MLQIYRLHWESKLTFENLSFIPLEVFDWFWEDYEKRLKSKSQYYKLMELMPQKTLVIRKFIKDMESMEEIMLMFGDDITRLRDTLEWVTLRIIYVHLVYIK